MRILVTRAIAQTQQTAAKLTKLGHECVISSLVKVEYQTNLRIQPEDLAGIAVTSARAIEGLQQLPNFTKLSHLPLYCVGDNTASLGKEVGFQQVYSAHEDVIALFDLIRSKYVANSGSILYATSVNRTGNLKKKLIQVGIPTKLSIVYKTDYLEGFPEKVASEIENGNIDAILIYSKNGCSALVNALKQLNPQNIKHIRFYAISQNATVPLNMLGPVNVFWPAIPNEDSLLKLLSN